MSLVAIIIVLCNDKEISTDVVSSIVTKNKQLSCRRETVQRFVSLNISLSRQVIRNDTIEQVVCKSLLLFNAEYLRYGTRYRHSYNGIYSSLFTITVVRYNIKQEAQLSQRDRATLRVIEYIAKSLKVIRNQSIIQSTEFLQHPYKTWTATLDSVEITLLSRACVSPYWYFIETMSVCHTIYEIFSIKEWRNLEAGGRGRSRLLKMAPFDRLYTTFCWSAIVSTAVCCTIFKI